MLQSAPFFWKVTHKEWKAFKTLLGLQESLSIYSSRKIQTTPLISTKSKNQGSRFFKESHTSLVLRSASSFSYIVCFLTWSGLPFISCTLQTPGFLPERHWTPHWVKCVSQCSEPLDYTNMLWADCSVALIRVCMYINPAVHRNTPNSFRTKWTEMQG